MKTKYFKYTNTNVDTELLTRNSTVKRLGNISNSYKPIDWQCLVCSNIWQTSPTKIIRANTECPCCSYKMVGQSRRLTSNIVDERLKFLNLDIERLQKVEQGRYPIKWRCKACSHVWYNTPQNILHTKIGCPVCKRNAQVSRNKSLARTNEDIDNTLKERNDTIKRVGDYVNALHSIDWKCMECSHVWKTRPNDIINNKSGCPHCRPTYYSQMAIRWLSDIAKREDIVIQHADNVGEYIIPGTRWRVDGFCQSANTVYEFHGDIWHGNPKLFQPNDKCHPYSDKTAGELYQRTIQRELDIKNRGYNLIVKWETE